MVEINIQYAGDLRCLAVHGPSGRELTTDAPVDNHGKGESFSPTDLVATALGSCVATIMGIYASRHDLDLKGIQIRVEKHMSEDAPRRIARLPVTIQMPAGLPEKHREALEQAARHCPVHQSLRADIDAPLTFCYASD
jgi:putative redox protein